MALSKEQNDFVKFLYTKYNLRNDVREIIYNNDSEFDRSSKFYVVFVKSDLFDYKDEYAIIHDHLYKVNRPRPSAIAIYPDNFVLIE